MTSYRIEWASQDEHDQFDSLKAKGRSMYEDLRRIGIGHKGAFDFAKDVHGLKSPKSVSDYKRWLIQQDGNRLYFCIRHEASGNVNTLGQFTGSRENADYMLELLNEAHDAREAVKASNSKTERAARTVQVALSQWGFKVLEEGDVLTYEQMIDGLKAAVRVTVEVIST
jgi:hypothetical protein